MPLTDPISVVVCAPISSKDLETHLQCTSVKTIVDLRKNSATDPIKLGSMESYTLNEIFMQISENLNRKAEIKRSVEQEIEDRLKLTACKISSFWLG